MTDASAAQKIEALRNQLLEAYIQRSQADEKVKALHNMMAGIQLGREVAAEQETPPCASE
jgi:hypothetical protein